MAEEDDRKFRARRVVGLDHDPGSEQEAPPVPDTRAAEDDERADVHARPDRNYEGLDAEREAGLGATARLGIAVAASSLLLLILTYLLPWIVQDGSAVGRSDARQGAFDANVAYLSRLTSMPLWGLVLTGIAGLGFVAADLRTRTVGQFVLVALPSASVGLYGAFLTLLAVSRIFGYWVSQLLDADPAAFHPHIAPWLLAVAGVVLGLLFVGRVRTAWEPIAAIGTDAWAQKAAKWAQRSIYVAAGALLALPLLPLASDFGSDPSHISEAGFYAASGPFSFVGESVEDAAGALDLVHLMLWLILAVSVFTLIVTAIERLGWVDVAVRDPLLQGFLLNVVFWIVLFVTMILLYTTYIPNVQFSFISREDFAPALNHVLPAALLLLGWTIGRYVMRVSVPYARGLASDGPADATANESS